MNEGSKQGMFQALFAATRSFMRSDKLFHRTMILLLFLLIAAWLRAPKNIPTPWGLYQQGPLWSPSGIYQSPARPESRPYAPRPSMGRPIENRAYPQ